MGVLASTSNADRIATTRLQRAAIPLFLLAYAVLRLATIKGTPLNTDEPQHAHVAWALGHGLAPYRQVFDNHAPLFHILYAPLLRMLGETADVMSWLRLSIIPITVGALGLAAFIGRRLWDGQTALFGCVLACALPPYLQGAGEFRSDALWAATWLAAVAVCVTGTWSPRRAFWFAFLVGATFALSLKTVVLLAGLAMAWGLGVLLLPPMALPSRSVLARYAGALAGGVIAIPALVIAWVALRGGLPAMRYDLIDHNMLAGLRHSQASHSRFPLLIAFLVALAISTRRFARERDASSLRRWLVPASALVYLILLFGAWPLVSRQDLLPCIPLLAMGAAAAWQPTTSTTRRWTAAAFVVAGLAIWGVGTRPWVDHLATERSTLADVLAMTTADDWVMDDKGAAIFRRRPYYFALESITDVRIKRGLIVDDIADRLVATNTHVLWTKRLPAGDRAFVAANYLQATNGLQVAGKDLGRIDPGDVISVQINLPGIYALLAAPGTGEPGSACIDGPAYSGPRWLAFGNHTISAAAAGRYRLVWQPAMRLFQSDARPLNAPFQPRAVATGRCRPQ
jgi:hypothetical protein